MKNKLIVGSALMLLSTGAFASKARLQSLGEDKDGSYYISDYRNVYINPAELNSIGNKLVAEWGSTGTSLGNASLDTDNATKAEGGVFYGLSNGMKAGIMLGDESDVSSLTRMLSSISNANFANKFLQTSDNVIDLFVSGQASVNWGANLVYNKTKDEAANNSSNSMALRLGASQGQWNANALVSLAAKSESADANYKGKLGFRVGAGYELTSESKVFGMHESYKWDQNLTGVVSREGSFDKSILGVGHTKKVSDSSTLFAKIQGDLTSIKLGTSSAAATEAKIERLSIPVTFGFEHSATDWLVVRGSVVQNLIGTIEDQGLTANLGTVNPVTIANGTAKTGEWVRYLASARYGSSMAGNGGKKSLANSTLVNAGMTLKFGKVEIDGNIGTTGSNRGTGTVGNNTNAGVLALDNLESRVGMTYNF
jgi:hypothetical protein